MFIRLTYDFLLFLLSASLLFGCSKADTLGGNAPDEVVIYGTPTWENGIGNLVRSKCATCHVIPFSFYTPYNTPSTLNFSVYDNSSNIRGANILGIWINSGILENALTGVARKMPLEYATPLTSREISRPSTACGTTMVSPWLFSNCRHMALAAENSSGIGTVS